MKHLFAVADEAECARLDDAGMDRSDIDLVQRAAAHLVERIGVHSGVLVASVPRKAQWLAPRVAVETYPVELVHLTLEDMERRMNGRERRHALLGVVVGNERRYHDRRLPIVEQQQEEAQPFGGLGGEVVSRMVALVAHTLREIVIEVDIVDRRYIFECNRRCGVACYMVQHNLQCCDRIDCAAQSLGLPQAQHDSAQKQNHGRIGETAVDMRQMKLVLIGMIVQAQRTRPYGIDDHAQQHEHGRDEPPVPCGDDLAEHDDLRDEQRRRGECQQHPRG